MVGVVILLVPQLESEDGFVDRLVLAEVVLEDKCSEVDMHHSRSLLNQIVDLDDNLLADVFLEVL